MSIYSNCYDLIHNFIYGGVTLTSDMQLICTTLASIACIFVFIAPFLIVWKIVKLILGF